MKIAIIWASKDRSKYWNIILRDLHKKWHEVFPVNPKEEEIEWIKCYISLNELPSTIEVLNFVTPPKATLTILKEANSLWLKNVRCQPWASDDEVKKYLEDNNFEYIVDSCIMIGPNL